MDTPAAEGAHTRVVIAGGGLVGLTLGGLLARRGVEAVVLERRPAGDYQRRGFMLGHHGYDALAELGLLEPILRRGRAIGEQGPGPPAAVAVEVGSVLADLAAGPDVRYGCTVERLVRASDGRVTGVEAATPEGPARLAADLVVACDGVASRVREMAGLRADAAPLHDGKMEWMSPVPTPGSFAMRYLSGGGHIGLLSWREGSFGWRTVEPVGRAAAHAPGLEAFVQQWVELLPEAEAGVRALTGMDQVFYSEPQLLSCPAWWVPGVVLIGDAAHFFGPETGASAGIGMADAHALAQAIAAHPGDADAACRTYEAWRAPAVRALEAMDPGRARLRGAVTAAAAPSQRWPPA